ncbi:glycosyltransferase family 4 protein [Polaromonas sp.]|uniref:glycosyltransferase family 4 protein n=1 Tax=Polaromonas sp. TaxID=1869339 RepID=UPI001823535A|nr:glycosyltransferase family 4 protein [Polaromonas sp.]NML85927.1 glycosyltransferase family 4 protein [Polaromonas sp.]
MKVLLLQKMAGISGSERYFLSILPELRKRGVDAAFLVVQHPANAEKNRVFIAGLRAASIPVHIMDSRLSISPWLIWRLARFIKHHQFDVIQSNLIHADVWGACVKRFFMPALRLLSVKHGYSESYQTRHGLNPAYLRKDLMSLLTRWAGGYTDRVVCISSALESFLVKGNLIAASKVMAIPYGFDFSNAPSMVELGGVRFGTPQIVVAGRAVRVKQHHLLIRVLPELVREFPNMSVVMVGAGPLLEELKRSTDALGLSVNVHWEGFRDNMHDYIRDSDLMVIPSAAEGFGLVVLEAWYHGKPVVAFDVPAINEIIESGVDGELVEPFDTRQLLSSLRNLLAAPERLRVLGAAGKEKQIDKYGLALMTERTLTVMQQLTVASITGR